MVICGAYVKKSRWCYQAAIKRPVPVPLLDRKQASSGRSRSNRISSKLLPESMARLVKTRLLLLACCLIVLSTLVHAHGGGLDRDPESTRLNSSHVRISDAAVCLQTRYS